MMQHMVNSMTKIVVDCKNIWFVESSASNHMTSHGEWFNDVTDLEKQGYVEIYYSSNCIGW